MRLINARTFALEEFNDSSLPLYAILSHTWETEEVLVKDMEDINRAKTKRGFLKIQHACAQAHNEYLEYVWVDTCCIDKSSSAELQEAINSMYRWYANAESCYVFLGDIMGSCPVLGDNTIGEIATGYLTPSLQYSARFLSTVLLPPDDERHFWYEALSKSKWFTRGWTLQELIAPKVLKFFSSQWNFIGDRRELPETISRITNIDLKVITGQKDISLVNVAEKMSWAADRKTSRAEDQAYSLLGLFGVNMPMLYGEGSRAFVRLQEEIIRSTSDQTIFAWAGHGLADKSRLLADSPANFARTRKVVQFGKPDSFEMTNRGIRINMLTVPCSTGLPRSLAVLNCRYEDDFSSVLALRVQPYRYWKGHYLSAEILSNEVRSDSFDRLALVSLIELEKASPILIEITRNFEPERSGTRLWLELPRSATIKEAIFRPFRLHGCADFSFSRNSAALYIPDNVGSDTGGLAAVLKIFSKSTLFLHFGFDQSRRGEISSQLGYGWLHVALTRVLEDANLLDLAKDQIDSGFYTVANFPRERAQSFTKVRIAESKSVSAEIGLRELFGEEVIVCTVRLIDDTMRKPVENHNVSSTGSFDRSSSSAAATPQLSELSA